jgi:hypothetical protein
MEGARASLGKVGARNCPIARGGPGGAETREPSRRGSVFPGRCETRRERVEGSPMEGTRMGLGEVGACDRLIACGEPDGAEKWKPSRRGSVLPGRCETRQEGAEGVQWRG